MKLSSKARYAVIAMMEVAINDRVGPVTLSYIAKYQGISMSYLEQLFAKLRQAGLVDGVRGPGGGYRLGKPSDCISIAAIITAVEQQKETTLYTDSETYEQAANDEGDNNALMTHQFWQDLSQRMYSFLDDITLAEFVNRPGVRKITNQQDTVASKIATMFPPTAIAI
jgi:Rrf2 family iron-sulfur cluster assembly transcriptional regulator